MDLILKLSKEAEELVKRLSTQVPKTSISSQVDKTISIAESLK